MEILKGAHGATPTDAVRPAHYRAGKIETIKIIEDTIKSQCLPGYEAFLLGTILKYLIRYNSKNGLEDLKKAQVYLDWLKREVKERMGDD